MKDFVFSADGHVVEPPMLFLEGLPASLRGHGIRAEKQDEHIVLLAGDTAIQRTRINRPPPSKNEGTHTLFSFYFPAADEYCATRASRAIGCWSI